jgi:ribosomal protein S18 acetylase RimI-like enzyme
VGRQLLEYAEGFAIAERAARLQVVVEGDNHRALDFYRGRGFVPVGDDLFELILPQR